MRNKYSSCVPRRKPSDFCQVGKSYVFQQMRRIAGRSCKRLNTQTRCRRNYSNARGILACGESVASLARTAGFLHSLCQIAGRSGKRLNTQARCRRNFSNARGILACGEGVASLARTAGFLHSLYQIAGRSGKRLNTQARCRRNFSNARGILACGEGVASLARTAGFLHSLYQIAGRTFSTPRNLAEREGFEPPEAFTSTVFKTQPLYYALRFLLICSYCYSQFCALPTDIRLIFMLFYFA